MRTVTLAWRHPGPPPPPAAVRFWGDRTLVALASMHQAIEHGDERAAAYFAAQARRLAIYAGTAARVLAGVR